MLDRLQAVGFDLDAASLNSLRKGLPEWEIEALNGATTTSLLYDWNPGEADLLIVRAGKDVAQTLGLCRFLTGSREHAAETLGLHRDRQNQVLRGDAPLLVLVPAGQDALVRAALEAGADSCLVLPIHAKEVANMVAHMHQGNRPGWHTLNLDRAQHEDRWRDDGGQG